MSKLFRVGTKRVAANFDLANLLNRNDILGVTTTYGAAWQTPTTILDRKTISIMKACELVGVSRRTIYNWIASGKVEYVRTAGGSVRIFVDTLWREPGRTHELTSKEAS